MKYFVKKSVLLLLVVLAFCACDNSNDNGEVIQPNPHPQSLKTVVNYRVTSKSVWIRHRSSLV